MVEELVGVDAEIASIEEELKNTKYNKATQFHIGKLKAKLSKLKEQRQRSRSGGAHGYGYGLKKNGDATILMVGFPSVGKSTLLNAMTRAESKVGAYDFTTIDVVPGVMEYNSAKIQVLDLPGLIEGAASGAGRGKEVLSVARIADLVMLIVDIRRAEKEFDKIKTELYEANFRLDQKPPNIKVAKKYTGGISVGMTKRFKNINEDVVKSILNEFRIHNADVVIREDCDIDRFIDAFSGNRIYVPSVLIVNKCDLVDEGLVNEVKKKFTDPVLISAHNKVGIEKLKEAIWKKLGLIRVYMKQIGREPDMKEPLILKYGSNILDVANKIHRNWSGKIKYARIWGRSAKFPGQSLGPEHKVKDEDIVELHF